MKKKFFLLTIILLITAKAFCTNLIGYTQGYNSYYNSYYPFNKAYVELQFWNGVQWQTSAYTYSGGDGYYYFYNVAPGYYYNLRVNNYYNFQIYVSEPQVQYLAILTL